MENAIYDSGDQGMLQIEQTVMGIYLNCPELLYEDPTRPEIFEIEAHRTILNAIYKGLKGGEYNLAVYYENLPKELETYATQLNDSFVSRQQLDNCLEILKERYVKKAGASILQDVIEGKVDLNAAIDEIMKIQTKNESTKYVLTKVSHIEEVDTEWIIPNLIPKYDITILGGDGGCGKTTFLTNLMAKLSSGQGMFFEEYNVTRQPMRIAYFSKEDETSRILKKKFRLQGANMDLLGTFDLDDIE